MPTRNVNLTERLDRFVEAEVVAGRYGNASEVIRDALRLLDQRRQEERAKLKWLRGAVKEGIEQIERGERIEFHTIEDLEHFVDKLGEEASAVVAAQKKRV